MMLSLWFSLILLFCGNVFAAVENIDTFNDGTTPVVNENFRTLNDNVNRATTNVAALTAYFTNRILGAAYGGTGQDSSNWTSGDYVYMSSTGVLGHTTLAHGSQIFTSSGTFTAPSGVTRVFITGCGAGASGGNGAQGSTGGGGGGASIVRRLYTVTPLNDYTVTIGDGGVGTSASTTDGQDGGDTIFDTITIKGGKAGKGSASTGNGGLGGQQGSSTYGKPFDASANVTTTGNVTETPGGGFNGGNGAYKGNYPHGGGSLFGLGANADSTAASATIGYCGGGGGAPSVLPGANYPGGSGKSGFLLIEW